MSAMAPSVVTLIRSSKLPRSPAVSDLRHGCIQVLIFSAKAALYFAPSGACRLASAESSAACFRAMNGATCLAQCLDDSKVEESCQMSSLHWSPIRSNILLATTASPNDGAMCASRFQFSGDAPSAFLLRRSPLGFLATIG